MPRWRQLWQSEEQHILELFVLHSNRDLQQSFFAGEVAVLISVLMLMNIVSLSSPKPIRCALRDDAVRHVTTWLEITAGDEQLLAKRRAGMHLLLHARAWKTRCTPAAAANSTSLTAAPMIGTDCRFGSFTTSPTLGHSQESGTARFQRAHL